MLLKNEESLPARGRFGSEHINCCAYRRWLLNRNEEYLYSRKLHIFPALLWTAPELIRENNQAGTKPGDIYSFAIIASEIVNQRAAWECNDENSSSTVNRRNDEEIVYLVKKGDGFKPLRPQLQPAVPDINPAIV